MGTLAAVGVWGGVDVHDRAADIVVTLVQDGHAYTATVSIGDGEVALAARRAVIDARERLVRGDRPFLRVQGEPAGALILVDGVERGIVPWESEVAVGEHRIEVRLGGYVTLTTTRTVVAGATETVDVGLPRVGSTAGGPDVPWVVLGGIAMGAGVGMAIAAIVGAMLPQACSAGCSAPDRMMRVYDYANEGAVIGWGVAGAALVVGGGAMLIWGLVSGGSGSSSVSLRPGGLTFHF